MMQDRLVKALGRIEIALGILETRGMPNTDRDENWISNERHERIKAEVRAAITEIDQLIGNLGE
jgi:hypothetical protein